MEITKKELLELVKNKDFEVKGLHIDKIMSVDIKINYQKFKAYANMSEKIEKVGKVVTFFLPGDMKVKIIKTKKIFKEPNKYKKMLREINFGEGMIIETNKKLNKEQLAILNKMFKNAEIK
jgi:transcriptional regulator of aromatic amino acid metabolism